jgi:hypothetical protein
MGWVAFMAPPRGAITSGHRTSRQRWTGRSGMHGDIPGVTCRLPGQAVSCGGEHPNACPALRQLAMFESPRGRHQNDRSLPLAMRNLSSFSRPPAWLTWVGAGEASTRPAGPRPRGKEGVTWYSLCSLGSARPGERQVMRSRA